MDRLLSRARMWLILGIISAVSAVGGTAALALTALKGWYVASAILALVTGHGYYGCVFYFRAMRMSRAMMRCLAAYESGKRSEEEIAEFAAVSIKGAGYFTERLKGLGIIDAENTDNNKTD